MIEHYAALEDEYDKLEHLADEQRQELAAYRDDNKRLRELLTRALDGLEYDFEDERRDVWESITDELDGKDA